MMPRINILKIGAVRIRKKQDIGKSSKIPTRILPHGGPTCVLVSHLWGRPGVGVGRGAQEKAAKKRPSFQHNHSSQKLQRCHRSRLEVTRFFIPASSPRSKDGRISTLPFAFSMETARSQTNPEKSWLEAP